MAVMNDPEQWRASTTVLAGAHQRLRDPAAFCHGRHLLLVGERAV